MNFDTRDMATKVYVLGKNDLSIENFPTDKFHKFGNPYIECYDYFIEEGASEEEANTGLNIIERIYNDRECEDFQVLYINAIKYLLKHCRPTQMKN